MVFLLIALILMALIGVIVASRLKAGRTAIPGSGNLISQIKPFDNFTRINVGNAFQVEISMAIRHSVAITADDNVIELIEVEKEGDTLRIGLETGDYDEVTLKVKIGLPELDGLLLTGATRGVLEGISSATNLSISLSGASSLEGQLEVLCRDNKAGCLGVIQDILSFVGCEVCVDGNEDTACLEYTKPAVEKLGNIRHHQA